MHQGFLQEYAGVACARSDSDTFSVMARCCLRLLLAVLILLTAQASASFGTSVPA